MRQNSYVSFQPQGNSLYLVGRFLQRKLSDYSIKAKCGRRVAFRRRRSIYAIQAQSIQGIIKNIYNY